MQLCLGKITKQSQTTDRSIFPRCYGVGYGDETGGSTLNARCVRMT